MVGNDIIDREETKRSNDWKRRGFLDKIFTLHERAIIDDSSDPFTSVWRLWSMKESAYKVFIQAGGKQFYNPKRIECNVEGLIGQARIGNMVFKTESLMNKEYIFSIATFYNIEVKTGVFRLEETDIKWKSNFVRQELIRDFSELKGLDCSKLLVRNSDNGVPRLYYQGNNLDISLSLTHHGEFVGYSFLIYPSFGERVSIFFAANYNSRIFH